MEPRPCGRGEVPLGQVQPSQFSASMEPRPCGRGEPILQPSDCKTALASMEPRPCGRGENRNVTAFLNLGWLQWSRALAGAEREHPKRPCEGAGASMEPRPCGRGEGCRRCRAWSCGTCFNGAAPLRARRAYLWDNFAWFWNTLQWSRALAGAESVPPDLCCGAEQFASMEPRPCGRGEGQNIYSWP